MNRDERKYWTVKGHTNYIYRYSKRPWRKINVLNKIRSISNFSLQTTDSASTPVSFHTHISDALIVEMVPVLLGSYL